MVTDGEEDRGKVVGFLSTRDMPATFSILRQIEDHWREIAAFSGGLPRRADLDAGRIASALPHAFILERAAPGVGRVRIAGRSILSLFGGEARGLPLTLLFNPSARDAVQAWTERCFAGPAVVELGVTAFQGALRSAIGGRLLLLPMLDAEGAVARALGGLLLDATPRRGPVRFDIGAGPIRCQTVAAGAAPAAAVGEAQPLPGLREAERPWLRLVVSNP